MSTEFSGTAPYVLIGIGALIILIGSLACCCTVKGQPVLLYIVSISLKYSTPKEIYWQFFQYGAFLAIIFVLELGAGISIYTYRTKLTAGFDKGLTQAMINYRNNTDNIVSNFDLIQKTVSAENYNNVNNIFFIVIVALLWKTWSFRVEKFKSTYACTLILLHRW